MTFDKKIETIPFREFLVGNTGEKVLSHNHHMMSMFAFTPISTDLLTTFPPEAIIGYALVIGAGVIGLSSSLFEKYAVLNGLDEIADKINTVVSILLPFGAFSIFAYCLIELMKMTWW
ncbi:hypothetical protein [Schinkia azotoformans]|uniref:hypothetical protein n=1 Tax=Schinkia azotoformans TaxID=1454 RepID=UPI002DB701EB|nr:hypothetical protein [Schinkia azotoformans]MEC1768274.1 hypothetical protein [Schinkia azotoformans]